ncbi:MAG TPA: phosphate signaling complex protein PhoU [Chloroflexia bacterium]|nr:phosphate signaling complex protein PhoU [Chloroflexia bacterium]
MNLRAHFATELAQLQTGLIDLGDLVSQAIQQAVHALLERDQALARQVIEGDEQINRRRFDWEERALELLATQSPVASDLRLMAAGMHLVDELERMGDHAKGIARISLLIGETPLIYPEIPLAPMAEQTCSLLSQALASFINRDAKLAEQVGLRDDEIDLLYNRIASALFELMFSDRNNIEQANRLLWAAHNLERIGDRITNICERVIFVCTGKLVEISGMAAREQPRLE